MGQKNILIVENLEVDLRKSRIPLGCYFEKNGYIVSYACPNPTIDGVYELKMSRNRLVIKEILQSVIRLVRLEKNGSVDITITFRLVPNILNYFASFIHRNYRIIVITGLGISFVDSNSVASYFRSRIIKGFYRLASRRLTIIAQNDDDLLDLNINGVVILGSGVADDGIIEVKNFSEGLNFLYVGRLLKTKGILEAYDLFVEFQDICMNTVFTIVGDFDELNPDSISKSQLEKIRTNPSVNYLGYLDNLDEVYSNNQVLLFPSLYREGVPRVIIEALKFGLTIITYDTPGCRETVEENGLLIKSKDFCDLEVMNYLKGLDKMSLMNNSCNSRRLFNEKFSQRVIFPQYLNILKK